MLTDIFAYRYLDQPIWPKYTETEQRLLNQCLGIVKDALPYWNDGKEDEKNKQKWKSLHDRLARELGVDELSQRYYSYSQKNMLGQDLPVSGWFTWDHVCSQFVTAKFSDQTDPDQFIKQRVSFIEMALRLRGEEVNAANANLPIALQQAAIRDATVRAGPRIPGNAVDGVRAWNATMNSTYQSQVNELNERFRRARAPLTYHNGFIQFALDQRIEELVAKPFWDLVADAKWKNVDIDMKEALDRRDSNDKDPAIFAAKALESAIKIVSKERRSTRGTENGAAQYVDNLVSKENGGFISPWEGDMLKDYFRKVRNSLGHGPGSEPMPTLSLPQTDWAIESAMSWIRTLIRRL